MTARHTPGPWTANRCVVKAGPSEGAETRWVAHTNSMLASRHATDLANARLIAAAPLLLAALKKALEEIDGYPDCGNAGAVDALDFIPCGHCDVLHEGHKAIAAAEASHG